MTDYQLTLVILSEAKDLLFVAGGEKVHRNTGDK